MLESTLVGLEMIMQAASNSLFIFCFCNLIIVMILIFGSKSSSDFDQDSRHIPIYTSYNSHVSRDKQGLPNNYIISYGNKYAEEEMINGHTDEKHINETNVSRSDNLDESECDTDEEDEKEEEDDELRKRVEDFIAKSTAIFAEIVPEKSRTSVYALDRSFESVLSSFAPPVVYV
ncbi:hypothetical protein ACFE04_004443 [Oxalis oulophora]